MFHNPSSPPPSPYVIGAWPRTRMRRGRRTAWLRRMMAEHTLRPADLIWPIFVRDGIEDAEPIPNMGNVMRHSIRTLVPAVKEACAIGIECVALFPYVEADKKTTDAREAYNPDNVVCRAIKAIKESCPQTGILCDVALDPFNADGHDGLLRNGVILNDETLDVLARQACVQANAGCDIIAPSDMMDGRIGVIRDALDETGHEGVALMSYAAKYASVFYGPFREAIGSGGALKGDKKTYQMDPANSAEALREVALDIQEGADMVMIKPGMPYLDVIHRVADAFPMPVFAYQVSGEYAMLCLADAAGALEYESALMESLLAFKRAGCRGILTYGAMDAARLLTA